MSIRLLAHVWELDIKGTEREVLQVMCDHADDDGREARPSIARIAWKVGCDERTVIRQIKKLREKGALLLERPARDHSPNVYRVDLSVYAPKEKFQPKGDSYADKRGDILAVRGDKSPQRGDTSLSPEPSFESSFEAVRDEVEISIHPAERLIENTIFGLGWKERQEIRAMAENDIELSALKECLVQFRDKVGKGEYRGTWGTLKKFWANTISTNKLRAPQGEISVSAPQWVTA